VIGRRRLRLLCQFGKSLIADLQVISTIRWSCILLTLSASDIASAMMSSKVDDKYVASRDN
jgi:hypothetical protein